MQAHGYRSIIDHRWNFQLFAAIQDSLNWTDYTSRAGSEQFEKPVFVERFHDVAHEDWMLRDVKLIPLARQFQQAFPRDAREDEAG